MKSMSDYSGLFHIGIACNLHCKLIPVMKAGFSLCSFSHREKLHRENPVLALYGIAVKSYLLYLQVRNFILIKIHLQNETQFMNFPSN